MAKLDDLLKIDGMVAVGGRLGVFIRTDKADFNKLFAALVG